MTLENKDFVHDPESSRDQLKVVSDKQFSN